MTTQPIYANDKMGADFKSVRRGDSDGRLHIAISNISKATVNPYYGREIPDYEALGLEPDRIYQMFRPPEELEKAAPSANNIQLLDLHIPVSADDPKKEIVAGTTGERAQFDGEYLTNSLAVWVGESIDRIEDESCKELSCCYRYVAIMEPGTYKGLRYDGKMTNIEFNHVALVPEGRAGPDVVVGDAMPGTLKMKPLTSRKALMVRGMIAAVVRPKLAVDAKLDFNPALAGVTAANYKAKKPAIIAAVAKITAGKLAGDAGLEDMHKLLDSLDDESDGAEDDEIDAMDEESEEDRDKRETAEDEDDMTKGEDACAARDKARDKAAKDRKRARDAKRAKDAEEMTEAEKKKAEEKAKDKGAMDAAIRAASDAAVARAVKETTTRLNSIQDAKRIVFPRVGELTEAFDSAAEVFKFALDSAGVELDGVPPEAYGAVYKALPAADASTAPTVAMDAKARTGRSDFLKDFPGAAAIRIAS